MAKKTSIHRELPTSEIINILALKAKLRTDIDFDFLGKLDDFRKRVSDEVRHINELFPEYTPHDSHYHLRHLFHIGDKLLGEALVKKLSAVELLILSLSLYGHDWGMAVSEVEKELIINNQIRTGFKTDEYALLKDEHEKFKLYLHENNFNDITDIPLYLWQEYVRKTHATRSAERVRKYFEPISAGLGDAVAKVCEGHWLDYKEIQDYDKYPTNYSLMGESVNLKALAIYLRLIDLFDISEDRTPFIIWKYVAPKDTRSEMEWKKHRAITSVTAAPYQSGRIIQVDGTTNDNEVYASLIDLKNYCVEQLKGANEILNQINNENYNVNIFDINWRIAARNFEPISIQFEFDRIKMFEILSDEIYQGDTHVFIRELLQNSIDAINTRKKLLEREKINTSPINEFGLIEVSVVTQTNGNIEIIFSDNGIGMDEYIVRNYLSVAGKSYYNSDDFKKLGLVIDPISKFGVGILSCFMVANRIDIETHRDPYLSQSNGLNIHIPSVSQQFRIESSVSTLTNRVGTSVKVFVLKEKITSQNTSNLNDGLNVTEYLLRIAGFVKVPIKIIEDGKKTLIIHPLDDENLFKEKYVDFEIRKTSLSFPWDKVFLPQSLKSAKELFEEKTIDIKHDLKIEDASGKIIFLVAKDVNTILTNKSGSMPVDDYIVNTKSYENRRVQIYTNWTQYRIDNTQNNLGRSAFSHGQFQVFLDGILIPNANVPKKLDFNFESEPYFDMHFQLYGDAFCLPYILIDLSKKNMTKKIDLSRTELLDNKSDWGDTLYEKLCTYLFEIHLETILSLPPKERLLSLGNLMIYYRVKLKDVVGNVPIDKLPVISIKNGVVEFAEMGSYVTKTIYIKPEGLYNYNFDINSEYSDVTPRHKSLKNIPIDEFLITSSFSRSSDISQITSVVNIAAYVIHSSHFLSSFRFLKSPWKLSHPIIQEIWEPIARISKEHNPSNLLTKAVDDIHNITVSDWIQIKEILVKGSFVSHYNFPKIAPFEKPFGDSFLYEFTFLNFDHSNTKNLIQMLCAIHLKRISVKRNPTLEYIAELFKELPFFEYTGTLNLKKFNSTIAELTKLVIENEILTNPIVFSPIDINSFVPGSVTAEENIISATDYSEDYFVENPTLEQILEW